MRRNVILIALLIEISIYHVKFAMLSKQIALIGYSVTIFK